KSEHTEGKDFNTSTAVIMLPTGRLLYSCHHGHCKEVRQWEQLRDWMQNKLGRVLAFGDCVENVVLGPPDDGWSDQDGDDSDEFSQDVTMTTPEDTQT